MRPQLPIALAVTAVLAGAPLAGRGASETAAVQVAATPWTIAELPTLGGEESRASALNERGEAAGVATTIDGENRATLWRAGGTAVGLAGLGGTRSSADDLNNVGQVTGTAQTAAGLTHAFLWSAGKSRDLGTLGGSNSYGHGINDAGTVAGFSQRRDGGGHGFVWTRRRGLRDLGTLGGRLSFALAINPFGSIVGASDLPRATTTAPVSWRSGKPVSLGLPVGYEFGFAYGVSFAGQVTGSLERSDGADAFLRRKGRLENIGRLGDLQFTSGLSVNSAGEVVGIAFRSRGGATRAFLWRKGSMTDLNTLLPEGSGWTLAAANDVNDLGQIGGYGTLEGETRGFVLTPPPGRQVADVNMFLEQLQPGSTAFERKTVSLLRSGCKGVRTLAKLAPKQRQLDAVRRSALVVRINALRRNVGC